MEDKIGKIRVHKKTGRPIFGEGDGFGERLEDATTEAETKRMSQGN